jgi:hypothetical protein
MDLGKQLSSFGNGVKLADWQQREAPPRSLIDTVEIMIPFIPNL